MKLLEERRLYNFSASKEEVKPLGDLRVALEGVKAEMKFSDGYAQARELPVYIDKGAPFVVRKGRRVFFTHTAMHQLQSRVLPSRMWHGWQELAKLDATLAAQVWKKFSDGKRDRMLFRAMQVVNNGKTGIFLRACLSSRYAPVGDIHLLREVEKTSASRLPVMSAELRDDRMTVNFLAKDEEQTLAEFFGEGGDWVPTVCLWNGETGCASIGLRVGLYNVKRRFAIPLGERQDRSSLYQWNHVGQRDLAAEVDYVIKNVIYKANSILRMLPDMMESEVEEPAEWLAENLEGKVPVPVLKELVNSLENNERANFGYILETLTMLGAAQEKLTARDAVQSALSNILIRRAR